MFNAEGQYQRRESVTDAIEGLARFFQRVWLIYASVSLRRSHASFPMSREGQARKHTDTPSARSTISIPHSRRWSDFRGVPTAYDVPVNIVRHRICEALTSAFMSQRSNRDMI